VPAVQAVFILDYLPFLNSDPERILNSVPAVQAVFMLLTALIMKRGASTVFLSIALGLGGLTWAG
jgi:hypothetical protein